MKNKVTKGLFLLYSMSLLIGCNMQKAGSGISELEKEQIKKEIQAKENAFAEIYNTGELRDIGYFAEDATTFAQNQEPIVGRAAIIEYLSADLDSNTDKISFTTKEVFVSGDANLVVEVGYYEVVDSVGISFNTGNYMCMFEKRDGNYVCVRDMSASDMPVLD